MSDCLYDYDKVLQRAIDRVSLAEGLSERKKQLVLAHKDEMLANGISKGRAARFTYYVAKLGEWLPCEFEEADLATIKQVVSRIEASDYVPFSKMEHKLALRRFYKWLRGNDEYPPEVKWIPMRVKRSDRFKLPEELLTEKDVQALVEASLNPRDRAFIAVLYESGTRISELALLRLKHIQFDVHGARIMVRGKTGARSVRIISSVPLLTSWINVHPSKSDPDAHLWLTNRGDVPSHTTIVTMLDAVAKRAGIKKPVNPHSFRHSRATRLACHLTEAQMKEHFGWVQASRMAAVYVHLSGRDVDDALLRVYGVRKEDSVAIESPMMPRSCRRCQTQNAAVNRFCSLCGLPLDPEATAAALQDDIQRRQADGILDRMLEDPAFKEQFLRKLKDTVTSTARVSPGQ